MNAQAAELANANAARVGPLGKTQKKVADRIAGTAQALDDVRNRARNASAHLQPDDAEPGEASPVARFLNERKRPLLYGLAAVIVTICSVQGLRLMGEGSQPVNLTPASAPDKPAGAPPPASPLDNGPKPAAPATAPAPAPQKGASVSPLSPDWTNATAGLSVPAAQNPAPATTSQGNVDPLPVGSTAPSSASADSARAPTNAAASGSAAPSASVAAPASADTTKAGPANPLQAMQDAAARGNRLAQFDLAQRFAEGRVVPRDMVQAAMWYEKAASQELTPAQYRLAAIYEKGTGVPRDVALARKWYRRAAESGNTRAMHNLAVLSADAGADGKPDYATAAIWFRKAAEYGVRDSQFNLAILYARGLGVEQSLQQSYVWFAVAAAQGDSDALKKRDEIGARLDAAQLADAKSTADRFKPRIADVQANDVPATASWDAPVSPPSAAAPAAPAAPAQKPSATNAQIKARLSRL